MKLEHKFKTAFNEKLLEWYHKNKRDLPWRRTSDPYKIWVSEVMLQQTQVEQATPYYEKFLKVYPDLQSLANAQLDDILKVCEGMGYYARARNIKNAADILVNQYNGEIPRTHDELIKIPGIGPYTAAAIASIAFNENYPVVDGNVLRVLARILKIDEPPKKKGVKSKFVHAARSLMPEGRAGDFNQAIMELGALVCTPQKPKCSECPVNFFCLAYQTLEDPSVLPVRAPTKDKPHYNVVIGIIWKKGKILIDRRPEEGLLGGLWEFPGGKQELGETLEECLEREIREDMHIKIRVQGPFLTVPHAYTHFKITLHSFQCQHLEGEPRPKKAIEWRWVEPDDMRKYAFPKANKIIMEALLENL
ncbi:MAG TPA: A/G-specific adenine glycosylase [bacterium]